jgi:hypothetical protein
MGFTLLLLLRKVSTKSDQYQVVCRVLTAGLDNKKLFPKIGSSPTLSDSLRMLARTAQAYQGFAPEPVFPLTSANVQAAFDLSGNGRAGKKVPNNHGIAGGYVGTPIEAQDIGKDFYKNQILFG